MSTYVGLDLGGTFLKGALVDSEGGIRARFEEPVVKESVDGLLAQLERAARAVGVEGAGAVGIGLPGIVEQGTARVRVSPALPVLNGYALGASLGERCGKPVVAENDANAAALAEAWKGTGQGSLHQLFVGLGTGVGGGVILNGRIWSGRSGYAGEIGHVQVDPQGVPCGCGSRGCLETVAGIPGWRRGALAHMGRALDPEQIVAAARGGDPAALRVIADVTRALGVGIAAALDLLNVDKVVIGGGVARAGELLLSRIVDEVRARVFPPVFADCTFALAGLGADAGVVGAARVAMLG